MTSFQSDLYDSCLNISIALLLMTVLVIYIALFSSFGVDGGWRKQIGKWSEISVLNIIVLKLVFTNEFIKIWYVIVEAMIQ